ncbi:MAG: 3-phosphoshikimate 1-carboxyvinyltransferase [Rikenellaceae bacterium]
MEICLCSGSVDGVLTPPCSKSYAQRALAVSLLASDGAKTTTLRGVDFCDDTLSAMKCIETLGAKVEPLDPTTLRVTGGLNPSGSVLSIGESGLSTRLFTPLASLLDRAMTIEGHGSILKRPMTMMIEPLRALGVTVNDNKGYLPFEVTGPLKGGEVEVDGSVSSQFITGLLLALPMAEDDTTLNVSAAVSTPYLDMTIETARQFGVEISHRDYKEFFIEGRQKYQPTDFTIEGDWSAASILLVAGAIAGEVKLNNVSMLSKQADTAICIALERAGAELINEENAVTVRKRDLKGFEFDATQCPDLFPALVALAAAAEGETTLIGTSRLTHKESNRALTLQQEYAKVGIEVRLEGDDKMIVVGGEIKSTRVDSHNDHRIAMSMAVSALRGTGEMTIEGAECVAKSYPLFFEDLESIRVK